jgi:hypothetical protein
MRNSVWKAAVFVCLYAGLSFCAMGQPRVIADFSARTDLNLLRGNNGRLEWVSPAPEGMAGSGSARVTLKPGGVIPVSRPRRLSPAIGAVMGGFASISLILPRPRSRSMFASTTLEARVIPRGITWKPGECGPALVP